MRLRTTKHGLPYIALQKEGKTIQLEIIDKIIIKILPDISGTSWSYLEHSAYSRHI